MNSDQHQVTIISSMYETKVGTRTCMLTYPLSTPPPGCATCYDTCYFKSCYLVFRQIDIPHTCSIIAQLEVLQIKAHALTSNVHSRHSHFSVFCISQQSQAYIWYVDRTRVPTVNTPANGHIRCHWPSGEIGITHLIEGISQWMWHASIQLITRVFLGSIMSKYCV